MKSNYATSVRPLLLALMSVGFSLTALAQEPTADASARTADDQGSVQAQTDSGIGLGGAASDTSQPAQTVQTAQPTEPVQVAQSTGSSGSMRSDASSSDSYSLLPYTRSGYWGINVGRAQFKNGCGNGAYGCDNPDVGLSIYTGGLVNEVFGVELGYMNTGKARRAGGDTSAQGVSLSLVGRLPIGAFNAFVKGGAIYSQTKVSSGPLSDVDAGKRRGWGAVYGGGVGYDFTPSSGVVAEWSRSELRFPGRSGRDNVDTTSLGYIHRF